MTSALRKLIELFYCKFTFSPVSRNEPAILLADTLYLFKINTVPPVYYRIYRWDCICKRNKNINPGFSCTLILRASEIFPFIPINLERMLASRLKYHLPFSINIAHNYLDTLIFCVFNLFKEQCQAVMEIVHRL